MMTLGTFYRQTWWLWMLFLICLCVLAYIVSLVFLVGIPALIAYSIYFGIVRVAEIRKEEAEAIRNQKST
ncbi:MAG TPA: hypothetical protein VHX86_19720 [Tepidisphaeraceae bacterium]|nr:hypothetical protein [Tepidisphaeraceae bacterium]